MRGKAKHPHSRGMRAAPAASVGVDPLAAPAARAEALSEMDEAIARLLAERGAGAAGGAFLLDQPRREAGRLPVHAIRGDAMRRAGILAGDVLEVDAARAPREGDVVVVSSGLDGCEARRAVAGESGILLRREGSDAPDIDPARPGLWTIHGVARRLTREL